ncbi:SGNH/GDSL hydrolase family protein [Singulisphaera sp. PoT]|uniref:SGNH/GDSL hydrolase family protein n=1 Tax=Singulisphaera sp. PoT TaxID=3411797 RepID=UPI003BF519A9
MRRMFSWFGMAAAVVSLAWLGDVTPRGNAQGPPLDPVTSMTSTQRKARTITGDVLVVESDTGLMFTGKKNVTGGKAIGLTTQRMLLERMRRAAVAARASNVIDNQPMASPPTITTGTSFTQTKNYYLAGSGVLTNQDKFTIVGGVPFANTSGSLAGNYLSVYSVSSTSGSNIGPPGIYQQGWYIEGMTDAPTLVFSYFRTSESGVMIAVSENGGPMQYTSMTPTPIFNNGNACGTNTGVVTIAFGSSKIRRVRIEFGNQQVDETCGGSGGVLSVRGFFVDPGYSIWKPKDLDIVNAGGIGDSYTVQAPRDAGMQAVNWFRTASAKLGWRPTCMAQGGTGYSKVNGALPAASDPLRLADLTAQPYDVFVFALGTNDVSGNDGTAVALPDIQAKALTCFNAARAANPIAPIIVVAPWPRPTFPTQTQSDCATAVAAAFNQFADPNSLFIPIYADPSGNWMAGTSYQGKLNSSNDISYRYIWADAIHPVLAGHYYYGDRVAHAIRDWLMSTSVTDRGTGRIPSESIAFAPLKRPVAREPEWLPKAA